MDDHSKDLFDETTMSFGEHLEVLRVHLFKAVIGLVICVVGALFVGDDIMRFIRGPIDEALNEYDIEAEGEPEKEFDLIGYIKAWWNDELPEEEPEEKKPEKATSQIDVEVSAVELANALHKVAPEQYPEVSPPKKDVIVELRLEADEFRQFKKVVEKSNEPVTLNVQEAFLMFLKVSFVAGLVFAAPWVFYQIWQFVAAGLYPHERKYVYIYLPMSTVLFVGGVLFCFFAVFPFVLSFLLGFNKWLGLNPTIRMSEWISFAVTLPLMFGISFQLPLVMLFLERISVFDANDYREKRRMAVLVIAVLSMMLTPADPTSMMAMMLPLLLLYELGIWMCSWRGGANTNPFAEEG